jgi:glycosyltransferase involved in cell wall biosynthesis
MKPLVTVITPTTGAPYLRQAIESVKNQTYDNIQHLVVVDGQPKGRVIAKEYPHIDIIDLPYPTGTDRFNGHRIYGASVYLAKGDLVCFLDEDNYYDYTHIESLVDVIHHVCLDDCESLGKWESCIGDYFVDVGCFFLPKMIAIQTSPIWYRKAREPGVPEVDRMLTHVLRNNNLKYDTNANYSLNYRTGNTQLSVQSEFFLQGNKKMLEKYNGDLPWTKKT